MRRFQPLTRTAFIVCAFFGLANFAGAGEIMTDRCSADVSFPSTYNGPAIGANSGQAPAIIISRANSDSTHWTSAIRQAIDSDGHIRWWCHSTTGNWADPGTWVVDGAGATYSCGDSGGNDCKLSPNVSVHPSDSAGWTAERSRCSNHSSVFRARLGPDRLLQIECLDENTAVAQHKLVSAPPVPTVRAADVRFAAIWAKGPAGDWAARHDLTSDAYQAEFSAEGQKGLSLLMVDGYESDGQPRYAAIWGRQTSSPGTARHGMTAADYQQASNQLTADGYRPVWVNGYTVNGSDQYAAIWEKSPGPAWVARHGLGAADFQKQFDDLANQGYYLKLISGYAVGQEVRYAAIWEKGAAAAWVARIGMTPDVYQQEFNKQGAAGYRLPTLAGIVLATKSFSRRFGTRRNPRHG
jgi:hypothetical protein